MEAGSDTTSSALLSFILAMVNHPEALKKAQKEVDQICGESRSPTFEDVPLCPYVNACMQEVSSGCLTTAYNCLVLNRGYRRCAGDQLHLGVFHTFLSRTIIMRGIFYQKEQ